ncbi:MAG: hypothetical protein Q8O64_17515, partial [Sideroxyarcus sp.]|nr:hypothetical protein [Sideroxyarcus sp.]
GFCVPAFQSGLDTNLNPAIASFKFTRPDIHIHLSVRACLPLAGFFQRSDSEGLIMLSVRASLPLAGFFQRSDSEVEKSIENGFAFCRFNPVSIQI